ncbi:protein draper isoform X3 [Scaptodrosophila lebanonensis]|uniref:Protein draper isoform X3 n=1 Tax=Drosophila lebanonensis TaxID=7225 RepID=A0A6J2TUE1_DROLE|nr:protein draper isoform X3 [Scaptodrosophila lebanonensis]
MIFRVGLMLALLVLVHADNFEDADNELDLNGPNICKKKENYDVEVTTTEWQSYQERGNTWCVSLPPRCSTYRIKNRIVNKTTTLSKTRIFRDCCDGYMRSGKECVPHCSEKCQHGRCIAPEKCKCDHGYSGPACDIICRCLNNSSCDPDTGNCICSPGWTGEDCAQPCAPGFYGMGCKERCPESTHGNKSCDHITGGIRCRAGYIGLTCEHPCPTGYYGPGCTLKCNCENGGECNHISGQCHCLPGWTGPNCNVSCPTDFYGPDCAQHCRCQNHKGCRKNDGLCICLAGWMGIRCDEVCPEGFYGEHCMSSCACPTSNFVCHAAKGCVCRSSFTGPNCDELIASQRVAEADNETNRSSVALIMMLFTPLIFIILGVLLYYRRRVSNLKTEIAHVQYISDPSGPRAERNHNFDNPVYGMNHAESCLLPNNLPPKLNNLDLNASLCPDYGDDSNASSRVGSYMINYNHELLKKNMTADLTNPNVYNSIEDPLKEEHVYDEIKQKEGYKDPDEYDHLDYSRPSTSQKPHYHRMNDTMLNINLEEEKPSNLKNMTVLLSKPEPPVDPEPQHDSLDNNNLDNESAVTASPSSSPEPQK